jgi:dTMP kinase
MDLGWSDNPGESFRLFQSRVLHEYERIVEEFALEVVEAEQSITEQQQRVRSLVGQCLDGALEVSSGLAL